MFRPVGEKMDDLHGFEFHARKEDARSGVQDTTRTTFMFSNPLTGPVTRDSNPLGDLLMCMPLGKKINSISPGKFILLLFLNNCILTYISFLSDHEQIFIKMLCRTV